MENKRDSATLLSANPKYVWFRRFTTNVSQGGPDAEPEIVSANLKPEEPAFGYDTEELG